MISRLRYVGREHQATVRKQGSSSTGARPFCRRLREPLPQNRTVNVRWRGIPVVPAPARSALTKGSGDWLSVGVGMDPRHRITNDRRRNILACYVRARPCSFLRKEVIQPHLPVRLPCYDFTPIANPTFDGSLPKGLGHRLRVLPTFVV
jgi:hypothetical protein